MKHVTYTVVYQSGATQTETFRTDVIVQVQNNIVLKLEKTSHVITLSRKDKNYKINNVKYITILMDK